MSRKRKNSKKAIGAPVLPCLNPNAAGVDIGATEIYIAVPGDRDAQPVRHFSSFTEDLYAAAVWLKSCHSETVAMESTGVYQRISCGRFPQPSAHPVKQLLACIG